MNGAIATARRWFRELLIASHRKLRTHLSLRGCCERYVRSILPLGVTLADERREWGRSPRGRRASIPAASAVVAGLWQREQAATPEKRLPWASVGRRRNFDRPSLPWRP